MAERIGRHDHGCGKESAAKRRDERTIVSNTPEHEIASGDSVLVFVTILPAVCFLSFDF